MFLRGEGERQGWTCSDEDQSTVSNIIHYCFQIANENEKYKPPPPPPPPHTTTYNNDSTGYEVSPLWEHQQLILPFHPIV